MGSLLIMLLCHVIWVVFPGLMLWVTNAVLRGDASYWFLVGDGLLSATIFPGSYRLSFQAREIHSPRRSIVGIVSFALLIVLARVIAGYGSWQYCFAWALLCAFAVTPFLLMTTGWSFVSHYKPPRGDEAITDASSRKVPVDWWSKYH